MAGETGTGVNVDQGTWLMMDALESTDTALGGVLCDVD
jgi:hypothetical protein